jgi:hypothetical protein
MKKIRRLTVFAAAALTVAAIVQQVRRPRGERTWHGRILGVPYDFRLPTAERVKATFWNPNAGLLTPHAFGVGWSINLYRLTHPAG